MSRTVAPRARLVTEADVKRLHEKLERARQNFRPSDGFLLERYFERLPESRRRLYPSRPGKFTSNT